MADPIVPAAAPAAPVAPVVTPPAVEAPAAIPPAQQQASPDVKPTAAPMDPAKPGNQADPEIKLPEGWQKDAPILKSFLEMSKKGLTPQGVIDFFATMQVDQGKQLEALRTADTESLKKELGAKFDTTVADARGFLDSVAKVNPDAAAFSKLLTSHYLDSHPAAVKFFAGLKTLISEDSIAGKGGVPPAPANTREAELRKMFPNSPSMWTMGPPA